MLCSTDADLARFLRSAGSTHCETRRGCGAGPMDKPDLGDRVFLSSVSRVCDDN